MLHIAFADDRIESLTKLISYLENKADTNLIIKARDGYELILQISLQQRLPDIVFMDINMPVMDGIATTYFMKLHYPAVKVIALSIYDDFATIKHIMDSGAHGYLLKAKTESIADIAIQKICNGERYIDERVDISEREKSIILSMNEKRQDDVLFGLTARERTFIIFNATTLSYEQIAKVMFVETKTIQTYFDRVSKKLNVTSRQALTIFSFQNELAKVAILSKQPNFG